MLKWKLDIFVNAVKVRVREEELTVDEILDTYPKLTSDEKAEIKQAIEAESGAN
jgi:uncharacterized protein (DUF433 family)